jgi:hypothetical protein
MPQQIKFSSDFRSKFDFPRLKLKANERARVVIIEDPVMEVSHWISGFGYVCCLGDPRVVLNRQYDPKCPLCAAAGPDREAVIRLPQRRFAVHVLRYITNRRGDPVEPITVEVLLWIFGEDKFRDLVTAAETYKDLRKFDIVLECTNEDWQRFTIQVIGNEPAKYTQNRDVALRILEQFKTEKLGDVGLMLGRSLEPDAMRDLVDRIQRTERTDIPARSERVSTKDTTGEALGILADLTFDTAAVGDSGIVSDELPSLNLDSLFDAMK